MQSTGMFLDDFPVLRYQWKIFFKLLKYEKKFAIMFCFQGLIMDILMMAMLMMMVIMTAKAMAMLMWMARPLPQHPPPQRLPRCPLEFFKRFTAIICIATKRKRF